MSERFDALTDQHISFIEDQHIYFVGTAANEGSVNVSPKGMDSFRVINQSLVMWLNLTGSGNETAAHLRENDRMTIMFCSFDRQPLILRLYGRATVFHPRDDGWNQRAAQFPDYTGARQIFEVKLDLVQTSCGFAVPYYQLLGERPTLNKWADGRGREGVEDYWQEKNTVSLDGKDTGIASR
ncbi:pyridoxamine 5'-phosphate oxidase family protein [Marinimicrobium sp. C6131]|uniref:pyridoxamine 5'-phosphate oxidase family protein n=1 Tax=Marinimicrobium sp. C6131 TaxID=3022676 RepID=UPI00223D7454|nr:pyridoxamine 5'-phosphate oxidase family protein [Marinimicrobium sp. C6131]UZJ43443.1 pyridoxamine 5'-phosphate oxidase family protein [Marinimicrobium sp. C6131]